MSDANTVVPTTTIATNLGNASAVNQNVSSGLTSANNSDADVVEGSGAGSSEQEMMFASNTNMMFSLSRRCRDRILIPCDFEEFITVRHVSSFYTR